MDGTDVLSRANGRLMAVGLPHVESKTARLSGEMRSRGITVLNRDVPSFGVKNWVSAVKSAGLTLFQIQQADFPRWLQKFSHDVETGKRICGTGKA